MKKHVELHEKGHQWDTAVLGSFDMNRTLAEIIGEVAEMLDWSREKVLKQMNFGIRNSRMGTAAAAGKLTEKAIKVALEKHTETLVFGGQLEAAAEFVHSKKGLDADGMETLYHETFTQNGSGELGDDGITKYGAELAAVAD